MADRVLFVLPNLHGGGAERVTLTLAGSLDRSVWDPALAVCSAEGALKGSLDSSIPLYDLATPSVRAALPALIRLIRKLKPRILFSTLTHLNLAVGVIRPFLPPSVRIIAREGNLPSQSLQYESRPRLYKAAYRMLYRSFDEVVAQSEKMRNDMIKHGLSGDRLQVIRNPVDCDRILSLSGESGSPVWPAGGARLLAAGRLDRQKGFDILLKALSAMERDWSLVVLGEGGERDSLETLTAELSLDERVRFPGFEANPYRWMAAADLFVLPSRYEGFPNVLLEALCCGTPVAAFSGDTSADEIVRDGIDGFLAESESEESLKDAVERVLDSDFDTVALRLGAEERFGARHIVRQYERLFSQVRNIGTDSR